MRFSVGSDPEMFVYNPKTKKFVSAIGIVKGTKEQKIDLGDGVEVFYDNVLAECNVKPANDKQEFIKNIRDCYKKYTKLVHPYLLVPLASHTFPASELNHPDSEAFGCEQSFCAYTVAPNNPPLCEKGNGFRSGGGHIHLGGDFYPLNDAWGKIWVVRMMDLFLGIPSLFIDDNKASVERRKLYGKSSDHRPTSYGLEYRSLSNFWLASPQLTDLIYELCNFTLEVCSSRQHEEIFGLYAKVQERFEEPIEIQQCIDTGNKEIAKKYMDICHKLMPAKLWKNVVKFTKPHEFDFYKEWDLK